MCTAVTFLKTGAWFGRNLDLEYFGGEVVALLPRRAEVRFRSAGHLARHAAVLGTARVADGRALFYDAMNEHGLAMAALHFPGRDRYAPATGSGREVASFELTEYLLCRCASLSEARRALMGLRITDEAFSPELPPTPLHWMLSDGRRSLVIEPAPQGVQVHENPLGVLTNAPEFPWHLNNWQQFALLTPESRAFGLPGDYSSAARFVRAQYVLQHSACAPEQGLTQLLGILGAVEVPRGSVRTLNGEAFFTRYTAACDLQKLTYHVRTYDDLAVRSAVLADLDPDGDQVQVVLPL